MLNKIKYYLDDKNISKRINAIYIILWIIISIFTIISILFNLTDFLFKKMDYHEEKTFLNISIYDVIDNMNNSEFSYEKEKIRESVLWLYVNENGNIYDIEFDNKNWEEIIVITISKDLNYDNKVMCVYNIDNEKSLYWIKKWDFISYTWKISWWKNFNTKLYEHIDTPYIALYNCEFKY